MVYFRVSELLKRVRIYKSSLPIYLLDYLGFHIPTFRYLVKFTILKYHLYDDTCFIVRPFTHDRCIIDEIFINKVYTPDPTFCIRSEDVVVDIGAHIGVFTIFAAKQSKDVKVYSYEPLPENFKLLKANVRLNKLDHRVKMFQLAVTNKRSSSPLYIREVGLSSLNLQSRERVVVETVRLEDVFNLNNLDKIDFLKVDVEGAEWDIFASTNKSYLTNIRKVAMECHSPELRNRLVRLFKNLGFHVKTAQGGHSTLSYLYAKKVGE